MFRNLSRSGAAVIAAGMLAVLPGGAEATSTINSTNDSAWAANIGWTDWRPSGVEGVTVGEFICSGYIWGANVGWISLGSGAPANNIQYSNSSDGDYGVNYSIDPASPGLAKLRGYAYGANIGWIAFAEAGNPRLRFSDGRLEGYAYSANCGWLNLGDGSFALQTDTVAPGADSDADGMADAFEFLYLAGLGGDPSGDADGDGTTNLDEYLNGTSPTVATDTLRITAFSASMHGTNASLTWTSNASRLYRIQMTLDLTSRWADDPTLGIIVPDAGVQTSRTITAFPSNTRFYRVRAIRPLSSP